VARHEKYDLRSSEERFFGSQRRMSDLIGGRLIAVDGDRTPQSSRKGDGCSAAFPLDALSIRLPPETVI